MGRGWSWLADVVPTVLAGAAGVNNVAATETQREAEDIVPYIPPLESYRVEIEVGSAQFGVPVIHPEDMP